MAIDRQLLGKAIRQLRKLRGLSQAALAQEAGMQGNSIALIERGQRGVSMEALNALADALRVPAGCLAMLGTSKIAGEADSKSLVKSLQKLIVATVVAEVRLQAKDKAEEAKQHQKIAVKKTRVTFSAAKGAKQKRAKPRSPKKLQRASGSSR